MEAYNSTVGLLTDWLTHSLIWPYNALVSHWSLSPGSGLVTKRNDDPPFCFRGRTATRKTWKTRKTTRATSCSIRLRLWFWRHHTPKKETKSKMFSRYHIYQISCFYLGFLLNSTALLLYIYDKLYSVKTICSYYCKTPRN